jgi:hypothetical protein
MSLHLESEDAFHAYTEAEGCDRRSAPAENGSSTGDFAA